MKAAWPERWRGRLARIVTTALVLWPHTVAAHEGHEHEPLPTAWPGWEEVFLAGLLLTATLYLVGVRRLWRTAPGRRAVRGWQVAAFVGGLSTVFVALASPLDALSDVLFSAHMTQHELLMLVAAPLLVVARPLAAVLWALPERLRERFAATVHRPALAATWRRLTGPVLVWVLHAVALWIWHVPALFEAALRSEAVHALQHALFFWTAALFWWAVVHGRYGRLGYGAGVLFVFTTALHSGVLGALLTWAPRVLYGTHGQRTVASGGDALQDQQLAGLIMWVPAGVVLVVVGLALFAAWLGESERRARLSALHETRTAADGSP